MIDKTKSTKKEQREASILHEIIGVFVLLTNWNNQYGNMKFENGELELITGGWSDNEEILSKIRCEYPNFWNCFYSEWKRGGYYKFEIPEHFLGKEKE